MNTADLLQRSIHHGPGFESQVTWGSSEWSLRVLPSQDGSKRGITDTIWSCDRTEECWAQMIELNAHVEADAQVWLPPAVEGRTSVCIHASGTFNTFNTTNKARMILLMNECIYTF